MVLIYRTKIYHNNSNIPLQGNPENKRELLGIHTNVQQSFTGSEESNTCPERAAAAPGAETHLLPRGCSPHPRNLGTQFLKPDSGQENGLQVWAGPALPQFPSTWEYLQDRPQVPALL